VTKMTKERKRKGTKAEEEIRRETEVKKNRDRVQS